MTQDMHATASKTQVHMHSDTPLLMAKSFISNSKNIHFKLTSLVPCQKWGHMHQKCMLIYPELHFGECGQHRLVILPSCMSVCPTGGIVRFLAQCLMQHLGHALHHLTKRLQLLTSSQIHRCPCAHSLGPLHGCCAVIACISYYE
jgi:hypothetical protein